MYDSSKDKGETRLDTAHYFGGGSGGARISIDSTHHFFARVEHSLIQIRFNPATLDRIDWNGFPYTKETMPKKFAADGWVEDLHTVAQARFLLDAVEELEGARNAMLIIDASCACSNLKPKDKKQTQAQIQHEILMLFELCHGPTF